MAGPVCRFAPSPNGYLHLGHALSAVHGFEMAAKSGGRFLLRIEDIDLARTREAYVAAISEDLAWLGLRWEVPILRQSLNFDHYRAAAAKLSSMGLLYPCFATRGEIAEAATPHELGRDPDGAPLYKAPRLPARETTRRQEAGEPYAMRLDMDKALTCARDALGGAPLTFVEIDQAGRHETVAAQAARWGDVILVRKDTPASYHLAVVTDDAFQGVTRVTRGLDLYASTGLHRLLQVLLGLPEPEYSHHRLLLSGDGRKLAKSAGDTSLRELRARGVMPANVLAMIQLV